MASSPPQRLRAVPISTPQTTVELSSVGSSPRHGTTPNFQRPSRCSCLGTCWQILSWMLSIVLYIVEFFVYIWVAYFYAMSDSYPNKFVLFGLSLGFLVLPSIFVASVSLVWYYNLDRFHRRRRERDPHNLEFIEYRKKFTLWALVLHILTLGLVYRFSQLIYLTLIRKHSNLPYLRRDAILVRFIHSFLSSAPQLVLHLYVTVVAIGYTYDSPTSFNPPNPLAAAVLSALAVSAVSVLYSILTFALNDRVSGKSRRIILPAHVTQVLWYLCMLVSRVAVLTIFAYIFEFYVFVVIGGHLIFMLILLFVQRTTFCADLERLPNDELKFTRRWLLEIPFDIIAAVMYVFVYFNMKRGRTRIWASLYHLLVLVENSAMATLIYFYSSTSSVTSLPHFPLISLATIIGLYVVGIVFMLAFYLIYHPKRTGCCFWVGIPKKCCPCCASEEEPKYEDEEADGQRREPERRAEGEIRGSRGRGSVARLSEGNLRNQIGNGAVIISQPTLISHNGFVPRNLLPVGSREAEIAAANCSLGLGLSTESSVIQGAPGFEALNNPRGRVSREDRVSEMDRKLSTSVTVTDSGRREEQLPRAGHRGSSGRRDGDQLDRGHGVSTSTAHASFHTSPVYVSPPSSHSRTLSGSNAGRTASESNHVFSDCPTSEIDTEMSSNPNDVADTVIDSPLFETTVIESSHRHHHQREGGEGICGGRDRGSKDVDSQRSCTDDTGIDVDSDNQLTQGTIGEMDDDETEGDGGNQESGYDFEGEPHLPVFTDAPAVIHKRKDRTITDVSRNHHVAEAPAEDVDPDLLPPPPQFQEQPHHPNEHSRDSVTPTLPTPTYSSSPVDLTPSSQRRRPNFRDGTPGTASSSGSQPSPERQRRTPRSPIGARAFQVNGTDESDVGGGSPTRHAISRTPRGGVAHSSSPRILSYESSPRTPRSPKGARRLLVQQQQGSSHSPRPLSMGGSLETKTESHAPPIPPPVAPPPVPPKDSSQGSAGRQHKQNGLTRGLSSLVDPPADRAQSTSPMLGPSHQQRKKGHGIAASGGVATSAGPSAEHLRNQSNPRVSGKVPVMNYSRAMSISNHQLSSSQRQQLRAAPRTDSWHESKANNSASMNNIREKRMSAYSGVSDIHPQQSPASAFTHHLVDRSPAALRVNQRSHAHPTPPREWQSPPMGMRSMSSPAGPPRLTKQGGIANYMGQQSSHVNPAYSSNLPRYPKYPQGALGNSPHGSRSPPRKRMASMPNRSSGLPTTSDRTDSIDEPLNSKSSSAAWSSSAGGNSSREWTSTIAASSYNPLHVPSNPDDGDDEVYDRLEPDKPMPKVQVRAHPPPAPPRAPNYLGQPRPLSYHPTLYAPTLSTHESAV